MSLLFPFCPSAFNFAKWHRISHFLHDWKYLACFHYLSTLIGDKTIGILTFQVEHANKWKVRDKLHLTNRKSSLAISEQVSRQVTEIKFS